MYADYEFYVSYYHTIPRSRVTIFLQKASMLIGSFLAEAPNQPYSQCLALCCCDIADMLYTESQTGTLHSENADGYSVTYKDAPSVWQRAYEIATVYLGGSGLMYRGVSAYE